MNHTPLPRLPCQFNRAPPAKPDEALIGETLEAMKGRKVRKFAPFMKNAIRLMLNLMAGSIVVLFELFPHILSLVMG